MIYVSGFSPVGGPPIITIDSSFDLSKNPQEPRPIIETVNLFHEDLVRYFIDNPFQMKTMNRRKFEELVAELFSGFGYQVELTPKTKDGGVDIIAIGCTDSIQSKYLIECKRPDPKTTVSVDIVRSLLGVKADIPSTKAIAVTTTRFSPEAHKTQQRHKWHLELKEYDDLLKWLQKYEQLKS